MIRFDDMIEHNATMSNRMYDVTKVNFDPPIPSTSMTVTVKTVYTASTNGFTDILVFEAQSKEAETTEGMEDHANIYG